MGVKLRDDLFDSNRWFNRLLWRFYRQKAKRAGERFETLSPGLVNRLESCIERHTIIEHEHPTPSLDRVVVPTGDGFSEVFLAAARLSTGVKHPLALDASHETMDTIGRHIGQAIIAWDCAVDFDLDHLQKHFTPLTSPSDVQSAFDLCQRELAAAAEHCPDGSASQDVLNNVRMKVAARQQSRRYPREQCCSSVGACCVNAGMPMLAVNRSAVSAKPQTWRSAVFHPHGRLLQQQQHSRPRQREGSAQPGEGPETFR